MQCVTPLKNGSKCAQPRLPNSNHCEAHRAKALRSYIRYKALHSLVNTYDHKSTITSDNQRLLMRYYNLLLRTYEGRNRHSAEFFTAEERDNGHQHQVTLLKNKLIETELVLSQLMSPQTDYENVSDSEDELPSTSDEDEESIQETPNRLEHPIELSDQDREELRVRMTLDNKILSILRTKSELGCCTIHQMREMAALLFAAVLKCDSLGYFDSKGMLLRDYYENPDNIVMFLERTISTDQLKIVYGRMLSNWRDVHGLCSCIYTMCAVTGTTGVTHFKFKACRLNVENTLHLTLYFAPTALYMRALNALCRRVNGNQVVVKPNIFYISVLLPKLFLFSPLTKQASDRVSFISRCGDKLMTRDPVSGEIGELVLVR